MLGSGNVVGLIRNALYAIAAYQVGHVFILFLIFIAGHKAQVSIEQNADSRSLGAQVFTILAFGNGEGIRSK